MGKVLLGIIAGVFFVMFLFEWDKGESVAFLYLIIAVVTALAGIFAEKLNDLQK